MQMHRTPKAVAQAEQEAQEQWEVGGTTAVVGLEGFTWLRYLKHLEAGLVGRL